MSSLRDLKNYILKSGNKLPGYFHASLRDLKKFDAVATATNMPPLRDLKNFDAVVTGQKAPKERHICSKMLPGGRRTP